VQAPSLKENTEKRRIRNKNELSFGESGQSGNPCGQIPYTMDYRDDPIFQRYMAEAKWA